MDSQSSGVGFKRKKKHISNYQRAMKYSKRGKFGHGFQIQEDDFQYFLNILKVSKEAFENDEDKCNYIIYISLCVYNLYKLSSGNFVDNVFKQLKGNEVNYCSNQVVSRVIDDLLPAASDEAVLNLIEHFEKDLRPVCCDQFASHVLQQLLHISTYRAYKNVFNFL